MKSTPTHYGSVAITLHWLSAILIIALLGSGFKSTSTTDLTLQKTILMFHAPIGVLILLLTLVRIAWWWFADKKPNLSKELPLWQRFIAKAVHLLFYGVIILMAASGIGMMVLSGAGEILFSNSPNKLPDFNEFLPRIPHGIGARAFIALLIAHIGAALFHHFVIKDGLISKMWYSKKEGRT